MSFAWKYENNQIMVLNFPIFLSGLQKRQLFI